MTDETQRSQSSPRFHRALDALTGSTARQLLGIVALWAVYVWTIDTVSTAVMHDPGQNLWPGWSTDSVYTQYVPDIHRIPPLARFDSVWYFSIATEGYAPMGGWGRMNASFMPLYGLTIRWVSHAFALEPYRAGLMISRVALLVGMVFLWLYARRKRTATSPPAWAPVAAMLFFPTGYILASVYSEAMFIAFCVATFYFADRKNYFVAFVTALLAGLTRAHVLALIPALGLLALTRWRPREWRSYLAFLPVLGATTALASVAVYFKRTHNDWLHYFEVKKSFGFVTGGPRVTFGSTIAAIEDARTHGHFGSLYTFMELPIAILCFVSTLWMLKERKWAEAALIGTTLALNIMSGALWGLPRYSILLFPMFMLIARLQRRPGVWHAYLFAGAMLQTCIMINFVNLRAPAP